MRRFLLDTNVVSEATKPAPSARLGDWMRERSRDELFVAALTLGEIRRGLYQMPLGARRRALEAWFQGPQGPLAAFAGRILTFDTETALVWGRLMAEGKAAGRPSAVSDTIIAASAIVHGCVVVTANTRDFRGVETFNPFDAG